MKIGILGAGATGLSAAWDISKAGHQVTVYERDDFIGGHASTFEIEGTPIEKGYHHWFTNDHDILKLCEEIGIGNQIIWNSSKVGTFFNGKTYNFGTPVDLIRYKPLTIQNRIRLGLSALKIQKITDWTDIEHLTASEWLTHNVDGKVYESFWEPMLRGKFGEEHYQEIGMAWLWGKMNTRFTSRKNLFSREILGYPQGSFKKFFDVLAEKLTNNGTKIHLSHDITSIKKYQDGKIGLRIGNTDNVDKFDAVIASVPSHVFNRITEGIDRQYRNKLTSTKYMSAVLLILVLHSHLSDKYWLNIADRSIPFVGVVEHTNLVPTENYGNKHIVYVSNYLSRDSEYYQLNGSELLEAYLPHLQKINKNFGNQWISDFHHYKIDSAQPIMGKNYTYSLPKHGTGIENLYLANNTQVYPQDRGTNYNVKMGREIARTVMNKLLEK